MEGMVWEVDVGWSDGGGGVGGKGWGVGGLKGEGRWVEKVVRELGVYGGGGLKVEEGCG